LQLKNKKQSANQFSRDNDSGLEIQGSQQINRA